MSERMVRSRELYDDDGRAKGRALVCQDCGEDFGQANFWFEPGGKSWERRVGPLCDGCWDDRSRDADEREGL